MEAALTIGPVPARRPALALGAALLAAALLPRTAVAAEAPPKEAIVLGKLRERIAAVDTRLDGVLGVYVEDLTTGAKVEVRADEPFPTASSIKLAILYELYRQAQEGRVSLRELTRPPADRVRGGGILQELGDGVSLSWRDLAVLMIGWSDNEATNVLVRRVGMDAVNARLDALGLPHTRLRRLMMDLEAARRGDENVSTPREIARLAAIVGRGEGLPSDAASDMLAVAMVGQARERRRGRDRRGLHRGLRHLRSPRPLQQFGTGHKRAGHREVG